MVDPNRPQTPDGRTDPSLTERVGDALAREAERAAAAEKARKDAEAKEKDAATPPKDPVPPVIYFDRTLPPAGNFELFPGVIEIGGGYFYDSNQNVIMEPSGDGRTFILRTPGAGFDPANPRLSAVQDLSQRQPASVPPSAPEADLKPPVAPPVPVSEATPNYIRNGLAWVDQTNGEGSLMLPPDLPAPAEGDSYWLWMSVPGRTDPVAVGRLNDVPTDGGRVDFVLPQSGLIPGNFILTNESVPRPAVPSAHVILKGP
jgi:hypothetical protein